MKFSIIIPCYKVEKYLSECVDSVLNQSFTDFELILVDDGSPDKVPEICDDYSRRDERVRVIHQNNAGIACARNAGISAAQGEYVICIDGDDFLMDQSALGKIASKSYSNPDVIMFGYKKYFDSSKTWGSDICVNINSTNTIGSILKQTLLDGSYIATAWTKAVSRKLLVNKNITFRPGMVSGEDVDWFLNVLCHAQKLNSVACPCLAYRQRPDSISHSPKVKSLDDFIWILENWPKRIETLVPDEELKSVLMNVMAYYLANTMVLYSAYSSDVSKAFCDRLQKMMYLFDYAVSSRALIMRRFYRLLGFSLTINLLKLMAKFKKR